MFVPHGWAHNISHCWLCIQWYPIHLTIFVLLKYFIYVGVSYVSWSFHKFRIPNRWLETWFHGTSPKKDGWFRPAPYLSWGCCLLHRGQKHAKPSPRLRGRSPGRSSRSSRPQSRPGRAADLCAPTSPRSPCAWMFGRVGKDRGGGNHGKPNNKGYHVCFDRCFLVNAGQFLADTCFFVVNEWQ